MKHLRSLSSNAYVTVFSGEADRMIELILVVTEPEYRSSVAGRVVKDDSVSDFRFAMRLEGLREFADTLMKLADTAEADFNETLGPL